MVPGAAPNTPTDTTLIVNTGNGQWRCNDDSHGGRMPTGDFHNPPAGRYDVWVGTYDASSRNPATFNVTVTFSEPVSGVNPSDLLVNGIPATAMSGAVLLLLLAGRVLEWILSAV